MLSSLRKFISWAFLKLCFGAFLVLSSVAIYALWLFRHDDPDFAAVQTRQRIELKAQWLAAQTAHEAAEQERAVLQQEQAVQQNRSERAAAIARDLRELQSWWERFFGNSEQQRINAARIIDLTKKAAESQKAAVKLQRLVLLAADRLAVAGRAGTLAEEQLRLAEETDSRVVHYLNAAWLAGRWFFVGFIGLYFFGRILRKQVLFYFVAPRLARGRPVWFASEEVPFPSLGESDTVIHASLWPGETARVRRRHLLEVDGGLVTKARWLLSWRYPLTSLLSGFVHDVHLQNARAGRDCRLILAHSKNPENQLALVHVPEGGTLVVRPSSLAGVILPPGQRLGMHRRWHLFRWQAWVTGQLCFLEFAGPCRLVVTGRPGLRAERLIVGAEGTQPEVRTSLDKAVGFSPSLQYRLIRTTRFWSYYRSETPLFDANFVGVGFVLIQTCLPGRSPGIWSATRNRARKVLGL